MTINHMLLICPRLAEERKKHFKKGISIGNIEDVLGETCVRKRITSFIRAVGVADAL